MHVIENKQATLTNLSVFAFCFYSMLLDFEWESESCKLSTTLLLWCRPNWHKVKFIALEAKSKAKSFIKAFAEPILKLLRKHTDMFNINQSKGESFFSIISFHGFDFFFFFCLVLSRQCFCLCIFKVINESSLCLMDLLNYFLFTIALLSVELRTASHSSAVSGLRQRCNMWMLNYTSNYNIIGQLVK